MRTLPLHRKQKLCNITKFITALLVVNGHLFLFGNGNEELCRFMNLGECCVALFYFFSGYGLTYSYITKGEKYLNGFFRKRLAKLIVPLITAYAIAFPVYAFFKGPVQAETLLKTLYWGGPYLKFSWFVSEIIVIYILFYLAMKSGKSLFSRIVFLNAFILVLMAVLFVTNQPLWYIVSLPGFIIGIWYCLYEHQIISVLTSTRKTIFIILSVSVWFICWQWNLTGAHILPEYRFTVAARFISIISFTIAIVLLMTTLREVKTLKYGIIFSSYYEIYLNQNTAFMLAAAMTVSFSKYWLISYAILIPLAQAVHYLNNRVNLILDRLPRNTSQSIS